MADKALLLSRVKIRIEGDECAPSDEFLEELIITTEDRLKARLGTNELPSIVESIIVDAVIKMYRRKYHEGISKEDPGNMSTSYFENVLSEYDEELETIKKNLINKVVRFI